MSIIKPPLLEDLKEILAKIIFSRTDKITKITDNSAINGILYGIAKTGQKAMKDVAIVQAHWFPDDAFGTILDNIANIYGIPSRFGALGSSTYIRLSGTSGTVYTAGSHTISGSSGIIFNLDETKTIGDEGFTYAKVSSTTTGSNTNVEPLSLTTITPEPSGHEFIVNEYRAIGGRDIEDDNSFRLRIKDSMNIASSGTQSRLEQIFMLINPKVLRIFNHGSDGNGKLEFSVISQNGQDFSVGELDSLMQNALKFFSMSELNLDYLTNVGITLRNPIYFPVDLSFRVQLKGGFVADEVRKDIQIRINKYIDYRFWKLGKRVEWDDLLSIVKNTRGVQYVPDNFFVPSDDLVVPYGELPRIRGFEMRDVEGVILSDDNGNLDPVYYPQTLDFNFIKNVLRTI